MSQLKLIADGPALGEASKVLVMVHGRGATAEDIITLAAHLDVKGYTLLAPQAPGNTWYPNSFLAAQRDNEPALTHSLGILEKVEKQITDAGIEPSNIYWMGFSQGACLMLEYVARHAKHYGGVSAFTGGLIGDVLNTDNYKTSFENTPIFIGTSDPDPHVPVDRVYATCDALKKLGANVITRVCKNAGHTITAEEIRSANEHVFTPANAL